MDRFIKDVYAVKKHDFSLDKRLFSRTLYNKRITSTKCQIKYDQPKNKDKMERTIVFSYNK